MPSISNRLREARDALGLSQQAMADQCGIAARSQRNYESGERLPDAAYLAAIASAGADVLYILTGKRDQTHVMAAISRAGGRVRLVRGTRSLEEFAALLGVTPAFLEKVEAADQWINNDLLARIVENENVSPMWLLSGEIPPLEGELNPLEVILIDHYRHSGDEQRATLRGQAGLLRAQSNSSMTANVTTHTPDSPASAKNFEIDLVADYVGNKPAKAPISKVPEAAPVKATKPRGKKAEQ